MRVFLSARFFSPFFFRLSFLEFSCVFSKKEKRGGIDLRRTRADHVCLTKPSECFRSVFSRYHEIRVHPCVQRANAKILRGKAVPGRGASIPLRLPSGNRDLVVCGS